MRGNNPKSIEYVMLTGQAERKKKQYGRATKLNQDRKIRVITRNRYPVCPPYFSDRTKWMWSLVVEYLIDGKVIQESDLPSLLLIAEVYEQYSILADAIRTFDAHFDPLDAGQIKARASLSTQYMKAITEWMKITDRFALSPIMRGRVPNYDDDSFIDISERINGQL